MMKEVNLSKSHHIELKNISDEEQNKKFNQKILVYEEEIVDLKVNCKNMEEIIEENEKLIGKLY